MAHQVPPQGDLVDLPLDLTWAKERVGIKSRASVRFFMGVLSIKVTAQYGVVPIGLATSYGHMSFKLFGQS
jgi:hypothetical protein